VPESVKLLPAWGKNFQLSFRAAGEPAQARTLPPQAPPDMDKLMAAANEYGVEILGPPPGDQR
jgi:hypothetical protein